MLSALLCITIDLIDILIEPIEILRDLFPFPNLITTLAALQPLSHQPRQQIWLLLGPVMSGECDFLNWEPFEHAGFRSDSGDHRSNEFPIFGVLDNEGSTKSFSRSTMDFMSAYLETTQISILRSSSPQFLFNFLVLSILSEARVTCQSSTPSFWWAFRGGQTLRCTSQTSSERSNRRVHPAGVEYVRVRRCVKWSSWIVHWPFVDLPSC